VSDAPGASGAGPGGDAGSGGWDSALHAIAAYAGAPPPFGELAYDTARRDLLDTLGCAMLALRHPDCANLLGPLDPAMTVNRGSRVPGTRLELPPTEAARNITTCIRWLDYNDTWLAAEWGHPSDNVGGLLALLDWLARRDPAGRAPAPTVRDLLTAMIQAHEIQGVLSLSTSLNRVGLDHVLFVRVATAAVATAALGGDRDQIAAAVSQAFLDGGSLRTYRHAPNTGSRKSWAAGDATARGLWHAFLARRGERGYTSALTAPGWGFDEAVLRGNPITLSRPLGSYVMENVLWKIAYPAEFHGQTAVEAALQLHGAVRGRLDEVERVVIETQESAARIIDKRGPLHNPADRDHCIQYMTAVALVTGELSDESYLDATANDPALALDDLRERMEVREVARYSRDYLDPERRSIANAVQVYFRDGSATPRVEVEYPLGHRRRRAEALPLLVEKARHNLAARFPAARAEALCDLFDRPDLLDAMPVDAFVDLWII
jgi:2-methylcitrate dehydratase